MEIKSGETVEVREQLRPILGRWWLVLGIALIAGVATYFYYDSKPERFEASADVFIGQSQALNPAVTNSGGPIDADRALRNQAALLQSRSVARRLANKVGFQGTPSELQAAVTIAPIEDLDFLKVTATAASPTAAARLANAYANALGEIRSEGLRDDASKARATAERRLAQTPPSDPMLRKALNTEIQRLKVLEALPTGTAEQVEPATASSAPVGASPLRNAIFAAAIGLLFGIAAAYGIELFDRRIKSVEDIESLYGRPVIAQVPHARNALSKAHGKVALPPHVAEAFRGLRTDISRSRTSPAWPGRPRTILVTSALPQEGKSTVVANLALACHEAGLRVAVVECDLRRPVLGDIFGVKPDIGVVDVLKGEEEVEDALLEVAVHAEGLETMAQVHQATSEEENAPAPVSAEALVSAGDPTDLPSGRQAPVLPDRSVGLHPGSAQNNGPVSLSLLVAGDEPADPPAMLGSERFGEVLQEIDSKHDMVLIDSPPLLAVSDAVPLLPLADAVLLVSRVGQTTSSAGRKLTERINRVSGVNVLGVVANDVKQVEGLQSYGYAYGTTYGRSQKTRAR